MKEFDLDPNSPWGRTVTPDEFFEMVRTGKLQGEPLKRYWLMSEFQQEMPEYLNVMVSKHDVERLIDELVREGILPKKKLNWKK